ncbi:MAG: hypothetical protein ACRD2D_03270, partial [Terriglobales bacterium]
WEETGLTVEIGELLEFADRIEFDREGRVQFHFVIADFLAWPAAGSSTVVTAGDDAARAQWFGWDELGSLALTPGLATLLERARRRKSE